MKTITVYKAQEAGNKPVGDVTLSMTAEIPNCKTLEEAEALHTYNAEMVVEALSSALPQGTLDRVTGLLMKQRASLFLAPIAKVKE